MGVEACLADGWGPWAPSGAGTASMDPLVWRGLHWVRRTASWFGLGVSLPQVACVACVACTLSVGGTSMRKRCAIVAIAMERRRRPVWVRLVGQRCPETRDAVCSRPAQGSSTDSHQDADSCVNWVGYNLVKKQDCFDTNYREVGDVNCCCDADRWTAGSGDSAFRSCFASDPGFLRAPSHRTPRHHTALFRNSLLNGPQTR